MLFPICQRKPPYMVPAVIMELDAIPLNQNQKVDKRKLPKPERKYIQARTAVEQGRADAYVTDYTLILNSIVKNPGAYAIAGDVFGPIDPYGIGLPKDSDGVAFVNDFLKLIEEEGTWTQLWLISLGARTGIETAPEAPAID